MLHTKALAIVFAYDIYNECAQGGLDSEWKIKHPIEFWTFRDMLSKKMLQYSPTHQLFPGDEKMRASMVQTKEKRRIVTGELECLEKFTYYMFDAAQNKHSTRSVSERLCGDLTDFERHIESRAQRKNPRPCEAYDADYYNISGLCNFPLHFFPQIG